MPCHTRAAAQTLQHLWVTDDVLAEAFNRFMRVSNTTRRHGSHVPGPLEARRRLAKRKMGMAAVANGSVTPPTHELGGLFGLALKQPVEVESGWKWQPPDLPMSGPPPPPAEPVRWQWPGLVNVQEKGQREVGQEGRVEKFLEVPLDPVEMSKEAFQDLLKVRQGVTHMGIKDVLPLLAFLQSSANEPDAHLTVNLIRWLATRSLESDVFRSLGNMLVEKITLATISRDELSQSLQALMHLPANSTKASALVAIVDAIPQRMNPVLVETTRHFLDDHEANSFQRRSRVQAWFAILRSCAFSSGYFHGMSYVWRKIYKRISLYYRPSDFAEHFMTLERQDFAIILLRYWAPVFACTKGTNTSALSQTLSAGTNQEKQWLDYRSLRRMIPTGPDNVSVDWDAIHEDFRQYRTTPRKWMDEHGSSTKNPLIELFSLLSKYRVPYSALLGDLLEIWHGTQPPNTVRNLFEDLHDNPAIGIPTPLAIDAVQRFVLSGHVTYALQVFSMVPSLPLMECLELPLQLVEKGGTHGDHIMRMLNRMVPEDTVPMEERLLFKQPLTQEHMDLVHLVAYAWAKSPHIPPRVAFRRVWECYRFLQDRGAPLSRLLSRALVRSGISRYLREGKPLAKTQVQYILSIVDRIEGEDVAKQLDKMVFYTWQLQRKNMLPTERGWVPGNRARRSEERADKANEVEAQRVRWRMKGWVKEKDDRFTQPWYRPVASGSRDVDGEEDVIMRSIQSTPTAVSLDRADGALGVGGEQNTTADVARLNGHDEDQRSEGNSTGNTPLWSDKGKDGSASLLEYAESEGYNGDHPSSGQGRGENTQETVSLYPRPEPMSKTPGIGSEEGLEDPSGVQLTEDPPVEVLAELMADGDDLASTKEAYHKAPKESGSTESGIAKPIRHCVDDRPSAAYTEPSADHASAEKNRGSTANVGGNESREPFESSTSSQHSSLSSGDTSASDFLVDLHSDVVAYRPFEGDSTEESSAENTA